MATGIEMLGQMGTDQSLAGPVQGGNMVVKPNQVPVGGAAMLSKALRGQADKGVGGMYVLPEQQDQTPDFMKIAKSNVMRDIEGQRNQYPMNYAENEGGIIPMLPRNLKTAPGADETTLAYITPEEQAILGLLNPGTPHMGPEQVPSYDSYDYGVQTTSGDWTDFETGGGSAPAQYQMAQQAAAADTSSPYHEQAVQEQNIIDTYGDTYAGFEQAAQDQVAGTFDPATGTTTETSEVTESQSNDQEQLANAIKNDNQEEAQKIIEKNKDDMNFFQSFKTMYNDTLGAGINKVAEWGGGIFSKKDKDGKKGEKKKRTPMEFIDSLFSGGAFGSVMKMIAEPSEEDFLDNNYKAIMKDKYFNEDGTYKSPALKKDFEERFTPKYDERMEASGAMNPQRDILSMKDVIMSGTVPAGSDLERRLNPTKYFKDNPPRTGQDFKDMATAQAQGKLEFTHANTQAIEEGRRLLEGDRSGGGQRPGGMGGGAGPIIEDEVTEAVVEEGATTMPYTGPRTGGAEVNVPLSRRFALDPTQNVAQYKTQPRSTEDIYKYFTEGTTGEGRMLEPYGEFQKRRRKAKGLEPLDFWSY